MVGEVGTLRHWTFALEPGMIHKEKVRGSLMYVARSTSAFLPQRPTIHFLSHEVRF